MRNALLFALTLFGATLCFGAEVYPSKTVHVIVNFTPPSASDSTGRLISQQLSEQLGKPFVVENRAGAGGTVGNAFVAQSAPDGYTLLLADMAGTISPNFNKSLPYDVARDFTPITQIIGTPLVLVVHSSLKANTLKEFIALAQANPGKLNFGSGGTGSSNHLAGELFKRAAKVNLVHIPYKGAGPTLTALVGGHIQMSFNVILSALPHVNSGRLRALAVTTDGKRMSSMPDVPSMSEAGVSGMTVYLWYGLAGPAGMSKEVVNKLHAEVVKALALPSVKEQFVSKGAETIGSTPDEFSKLIRNELQRWAKVIKAAGITPK